MLRDYQERAVGLVLGHLRDGEHTCLVLPTGGGKTRCAVAIAERFGQPYAVLTNRRELKRQGLAAGLQNVLSWQQLALNPTQYPDVRLLIVDEAHFAATDGPMQEALACFPNAVRLGLTATPSRGDGAPLGPLFGKLVVGANYSDLIAAGHLVPTRVFRPAEELDGLAKAPLEEYQLRTPGQRAVVFAGGTEDGLEITRSFQEAGIKAAFVGQGTSNADRDAYVAALASGEITVLVNVFVLSAGWDCPPAEVCILARGFEAAGTYIQAVGRVMRPSPGKHEATVLDLRGVSHRHGLPSQDRVYSLEGNPIDVAKPLRLCPACGYCYEPGPPRCPSCGYKPTAEEERKQRILNRKTELAGQEKKPADLDELDRLLMMAAQRGWALDWAVRAYLRTHERPAAWPPNLYDQVVASLRAKGKPRTQAHAIARSTLL